MVVLLTRVGIEFECALGGYSSCLEDFDGAASWTFTAEITSAYVHTGQCKRTGGSYNELVVAFFSTGGGVKGKKIYTC